MQRDASYNKRRRIYSLGYATGSTPMRVTIAGNTQSRIFASWQGNNNKVVILIASSLHRYELSSNDFRQTRTTLYIHYVV